MKIIQTLKSSSKKDNKSFQKEYWDQHWSQNSFAELVAQLEVNPAYWRLKKLITKKDKVLEAGCGFGQWVWALSSQGYNITGIDIAQGTIKKLKKKYPKLSLKIADVEKLPFKNSFFDAYLSYGVIEHFPEGPQRVLKEANRVLKKRGLLYLTIPYLNFWRAIRYGIYDKPNEGKFYQYLYSEGEIKKYIENAGFTIDFVYHLDFISAIKKDFPFINMISTVFFGDQKVSINYKGEESTIKNKDEPTFFLQNLLYKIDSYILLIEAHKK